MKTNTNLNVTVTLNADDILQLVEDGELKDNGVVIGTTEPERETVVEKISDRNP